MSGSRSTGRLGALVCAVAVLLGTLAWLTMPREEDPRLPERFGAVTVLNPGADAPSMERQVMRPLEDALADVSEIHRIHGAARSGVVVLSIDLQPTAYDTEAAWSAIEDAIDVAARDFPDSAHEPELSRGLDQESMIYAVSGPGSILELYEQTRALERALLEVDGVRGVKWIGDPEPRITIEYDDIAARRLGFNQVWLADVLSRRNAAIPGGTLELGSSSLALRPRSAMESVQELARTPLMLGSGASVPLDEFAQIRREPADPPSSRMRFMGRSAIGLGIVADQDIDLVELGARVEAAVERVRGSLDPFEIDEVTFQPRRVEARIDELARSMLASLAIVGGLILLTMGLRLSVVISSTVPIVVLGTLGAYWMGGGILHQISIAAFVIALGMLVDNAIVVAESIQARRDAGQPPALAARATVTELRVPLTIATGTTVAAFLPMALAPGNTADFVRAIPIVVTVALVASLGMALWVTPMLAARVLVGRGRARPGPSAPSGGVMGRVGRSLGLLASRHPGPVLLVAFALVLATGSSARTLGQRFFPSADRNQFVVRIEMPAGTHIEATDAVTARLERELLARPEVERLSAYVGRSAPFFYYNFEVTLRDASTADILVQTRSAAQIPALADALRRLARDELPEASVQIRMLAQGPPLVAPIELRVFAPDDASLDEATHRVYRRLRDVPGAVDVRHDLDPGAPTAHLKIHDAAAARRRVDRAEVARSVLGRTRGIQIGEFRGDDEPIPIVLRSSSGEHTPLEAIPALDVPTESGALVPLGQTSTLRLDWQPSEIHHEGGRRVAHVLAGTAPGTSVGDVRVAYEALAAEAEPLPEGAEIRWGGALGGSADANDAMLRVAPIGALMLVVFLMLEFNSFRRVAIILITVPLAAAGVIPGLQLSGQPFGFMSLLGVMSLAGIVVNNAIVLIDAIDRARARGVATAPAVVEAVAARARPIALTTGTTAVGLLPLALTSSTLWPPMAWALISGLLASTMLTLLVIPSCYMLLVGSWSR